MWAGTGAVRAVAVLYVGCCRHRVGFSVSVLAMESSAQNAAGAMWDVAVTVWTGTASMYAITETAWAFAVSTHSV